MGHPTYVFVHRLSSLLILRATFDVSGGSYKTKLTFFKNAFLYFVNIYQNAAKEAK